MTESFGSIMIWCKDGKFSVLGEKKKLKDVHFTTCLS